MKEGISSYLSYVSSLALLTDYRLCCLLPTDCNKKKYEKNVWYVSDRRKKDPITSATAGYTNENAVFLIEPFIWRALARCEDRYFFPLLLEDRRENENRRCARA